MKEYIRVREKQEKTSRTVGAVLAVSIPLLAVLLCSCSGFKYIWPPPQETSFVIDFTEEVEPVIQHRNGSQPRAEEVDRTKAVELIQKSESPYVADSKQNLTPATKPDPVGDVDVPTPAQEPELDPRASFPGMSKKDTTLTAPHTATEASEGFKAGQPQGNTDKGQTIGKPNAHLQGRNVVGSLPRPAYSVQQSGTVVVTIWVDQYGNVTKAQPGAEGTTVTDKTLWNAARTAALGAHFNQKADAPALQQGTITYIFTLK